MKKIAAILFLLILLPVQAQSATISGMRLWTAPDHVRLVFDSDAPLAHKLFSLKNPNRLVIDFSQVRFTGKLANPDNRNKLIKKVRGAKKAGSNLRIVVDLKEKIKPKSFLLEPNRQYGHRLVVDLYPTARKKVKAKPRPAPSKIIEDDRDIVIAIDAGHGGEDAGASGPNGVTEKQVVMQIARKLEQLVKKEKGMRPVMIRTGDYYMGLRKRIKRARAAKADLFISIHADAFRDPRVSGSSVYTLSQNGATSEAARWIAKNENRSDAIGGVGLDGKDDVLRTVLLDLSQTATMQASSDAANYVLRGLKKIGKTHKKTVQRAGFVVLKSPDIPSVLVETAFISNPNEERKLRDSRHQKKLADAMMTGIRKYFKRFPPQGTLLAKTSPKRHRIHRGETLSEIAEQYSVSLKKLRAANQLSGDRIRIGQVLTIPRT